MTAQAQLARFIDKYSPAIARVELARADVPIDPANARKVVITSVSKKQRPRLLLP